MALALKGPTKGEIIQNDEGQAITEYILLLSIVAGIYLMTARALSDFGLTEKMMRPITQDFARAYRYGNSKTKGFDDGGPEFHPRARGGESNFRIFINPERR